MDVFTALAAPPRRELIAALGRGARSVNELAAALDANQPTVSKHLKVLREAGFVSVRGEAQQRIYQLEPRAFTQLDAWLEPYRRLWTRHLDALERHLDQEHPDEETGLPAGRARRRRGAPRRKR